MRAILRGKFWRRALTVARLRDFYNFEIGLKFRAAKNGRGDRIRTCDPLLPKQMRYQAALLPESVDSSPHLFIELACNTQAMQFKNLCQTTPL